MSSSFKFVINKDEFLEYHLYLNSITKTLANKRLMIRLILFITYLLGGLYFYFVDHQIYAAYIFIVLSPVWYFVYPLMSKGTYTRFYKKYISENYQTKMTREITFTFEDNYFSLKDNGAESKFNVSEIEKVMEIKSLFLVKLKNASVVLLPKNKGANTPVVNSIFAAVGIPIQDETNWRWK